WLGHRPAYSANLRRRTQHQSRLALPGALSAPRKKVGGPRGGEIRKQSPGEILFAHPCRAKTTYRRRRELEAALDSDHASAPSNLAGGSSDVQQGMALCASHLPQKPDGARDGCR